MTNVAMKKIGEIVTFTAPSPNRNYSKSKMQKRGLKSGSVRHVTATDAAATGGYQLVGDWLTGGAETELPVGSVVVEQEPDREFHAYLVLPDGKLGHLISGTSREIVSIRKAVEAAIADPIASMRVIAEYRARALEVARADLDQYLAQPYADATGKAYREKQLHKAEALDARWRWRLDFLTPDSASADDPDAPIREILRRHGVEEPSDSLVADLAGLIQR